MIGLGGSAGTTIGTAAMRALPIGVPKLMVSTLASGQVRPYVGDKDILMLNSVVDIAGINRISRAVLGEAAAAMAGMVKLCRRPIRSPQSDSPTTTARSSPPRCSASPRPASSTPARSWKTAGYEVLVFHATGNGGQAMESLIRDGLIAGVLDITTTELADELVGGILSAGPDRLTAAAQRRACRRSSPSARSTWSTSARARPCPRSSPDRKFHVHNASVTLMRTTPEENAQLGEEIETM